MRILVIGSGGREHDRRSLLLISGRVDSINTLKRQNPSRFCRSYNLGNQTDNSFWSKACASL